MASKDRRAELEAELASLDDDDEGDEVEIGLGEGKYFRGTYGRAKKLGYVKEPEPKAPAGDGKDGGDVKRFQSGRRVS